MTRLQSILARIAAAVALVALVIVPPVLVARLIGRPYPEWSTFSAEIDTGEVSADTVMRVAALLFVAIWIWIVATIGAETYRLTAARRLPGSRLDRSTAVDASRRTTILHRLVRIAVLGTVTTAATVSTWPATAIATPSRSLAHSINPPPPVTAPVDPTDQRPRASVTTTIVANGRVTPLSIAVDLGDESLRDDIIAMNRSTEWTGGVFPDGMVVTIPLIEQPRAAGQDDEAVDVYVVQPNDGLWNVAEAFLGDGARHHELRSLLDGQEVAPGVVFTADTTVIHPGWTFRNPESLPLGETTAHRVASGDTLSGIAERYLGDPDRWPELWDANGYRLMADGQTFDDPDLILPGWRIDIPAPTQVDVGDPGPTDVPPEAPPQTEPAAAEPLPVPVPEVPSPTVAPQTAPTTSTPSTHSPTTLPTEPPSSVPALALPSPSLTENRSAVGEDETAVIEGIWTTVERSVWPTLIAGSLLTAGLAATVHRLRNRRLSQLRAGERLARPPDGVAGTEHALRARADQHRLDTLSALLRSFTPNAASHHRTPAVRAVQLGVERIEVLLARPEPLTPRGWTTTDGGQSWTHRFDEPVDEHRQLLTPALVTIGARTDDHADEVLLDLETAGSLAIAGDRKAAIGLARSIVLELATYPLGVSMDVSLIGIHLDATEQCDRVWTDTSIDRALAVARRRNTSQLNVGKTITAARAELDEDDGGNDPHVLVVDTENVFPEQQPLLAELVALCGASSGTAVVVVGDHDATERVVIDENGIARWSGVELQAPVVTDQASEEVAELFDHVAEAEPELAVADEFMTALLHPDRAIDQDDEGYHPPSHDVLIQLMGEPRAHGIELSADQTELLALLTCLRHRAEIHIGLVHDSVAPDRARKTIENRMSKLRKALGVGSDGHDLLPDAAPGRGGRSHYLVSPLVLTDIDLLEHRYHAAKHLSSGEAIGVLRDGLDLMRGPLCRARRGYDFWPHSEGVVVRATNIIQSYACRLVELAAEADDPALVLRTTSTSGCVLDNPLAEFPIRQAEQAYADASGSGDLLASVERARRELLEHIDNDDTFAEAR